MNFDKFTAKAQEVLNNAQRLVLEKQHQYMDLEHLFFVMLNEPMVCHICFWKI